MNGRTTGEINPTAYDRFSIVAFAPPEILEEVDELRLQAPPSGRPIMRAHITVKGTFVDPVNLHEIVEAIRGQAAQAQQSTVIAERVHSWNDGSSAGIALLVDTSDSFMALHRRLVEALADRCTTIYPMETTGQFAPHLTLVQAIPASGLPEALAVVERFRPQYRFLVRDIALVGRRDGTTWEALATFSVGE